MSDAHDSQPIPKWFTAYRFIRGEIQRSRWGAGELISANVIAQELSMSRSPVQQALRMLASDGLVEIVPQVGFVIRKPSPSELAESFRVRIALDRLAAELAAERADADTCADLRDIIKHSRAAADSGDGATYARLNSAFHDLLYEAARCSPLRTVAHRLREHFEPLDDGGAFFEPRMERSLADHTAIVAAIEDHDPRKAGKLMTEHAEDCRSAALKYIAVEAARDECQAVPFGWRRTLRQSPDPQQPI